MPIKIENQADTKLPRQTEDLLRRMLESLPREHTKGIDRVRLVDTISDPRVRLTRPEQLPGLYHPRQGIQPAWLEVSINTLLPRDKPLFKRLFPRLSFKNNLAAVLFSLVAQHYHLTLRHSVKKGQLEAAVRTYTEKYLRLWAAQQHTVRARLFRPLQPIFERWAKNLQRRAAQERKKGIKST